MNQKHKIALATSHQEKFKEFIRNIAERIPLKAIILFGSRARGDFTPFSDYDMLIVGDFKEKFILHANWVINYSPESAIDLFCYTPSEYNQLFWEYNITIMDAMEDGLVLFGEEFITPYRIHYQHFLDTGMKRRGHVLILPQ